MGYDGMIVMTLGGVSVRSCVGAARGGSSYTRFGGFFVDVKFQRFFSFSMMVIQMWLLLAGGKWVCFRPI